MSSTKDSNVSLVDEDEDAEGGEDEDEDEEGIDEDGATTGMMDK